MPHADWRRPPAGTSPQTFFEEWLPQAFVASGKPALSDAVCVRTTLTGPAGGTWELLPREGALEVAVVGASGSVAPEASSARSPDVWIRQTVPDFTAALGGDPDLPELLPSGWSALDVLFLDPRDRDLLRQIDGRVMLEISGRRRRRWVLDVGIGPAGISAGRPRSTVRVDGDTFANVRDGRVPPVQPLLNGKVKLEGDRTLAMQLLLLLGSRLARS